MVKKYISYFAPLIVLMAFFLDGQLSTLLINWSPDAVSISSHLLLIVGIFCSFYLPLNYSLALYTMVGLFYDIHYLGVIGVAVTLLPLSIYLIYYFYQNLTFRKITNQIILLVVIFVFKFIGFLLARLFNLTNLSMFIFVFYDLMPTLVFNSLFLLLLHPILKPLFGITNKT